MLINLGVILLLAINPEEEKNIRFIVETLGNTSTLSLAFKKSALEAAGKKTRAVPPLEHLAYVFSDPKLARDARNMGSLAWNNYAEGFIDALNKSDVTQKKIDTFIAETKKEDLRPLLEKHNWKSFLEGLRNNPVQK